MYAPSAIPGVVNGRQPAFAVSRAARPEWSGSDHKHQASIRQEGDGVVAALVGPAASDSAGPVSTARVLLAEEDERVRRALARLLEGEGYRVVEVEDPAALPAMIERERPDAVLVDIDLPELPRSEAMAAARACRGAGRIIAMTSFPSAARANRARLEGFDILAKPLVTDDVLLAVDRAIRPQHTNIAGTVKRRWADADIRRRLVGESAPMERLFASIERVAPLLTTVLITGETGTGKELVARAIHDLSDRANRPFVPVHCAALPETLLESELFGHVRGSFTGALNTRAGLLEEANGGTLFLDEVSTLTPAIQVKLLRALQERTVQRIGTNKPIQLDLRIVAASNVDLAAEVRAGRFRELLYYRLHVFPIRVPPLRERKADIPLLVDHFRRAFADANGIEPSEIPAETLLRMTEHEWPGNVRELENTVERMLVTHLGSNTARFEPPDESRQPALQLVDQGRLEGWDLARMEREYILCTLEELGGRRGATADRLGIDRRTLGRKLQAYRMVAG